MPNQRRNFYTILQLSIGLLMFGQFLSCQWLTAPQTAVQHDTAEQIVTQADQRNSADTYDQELMAVQALVLNSNPETALNKLKADLAVNATLERFCHPLVHEIGRAAYQKYQNFSTAVSYQDEVCNSGYLHGVIEAHFAQVTDIVLAMQTVCDGVDPGRCFHAVGHGVMYATHNDLPQSLTLCDTYATTMARSQCYQGVFMENFNTDQKLHPSKFLKTDDPAYPCPEQAQPYKAICYFYAPTYYLTLHPQAYEEALQWCQHVEVGYEALCVAGVGSRMMKENLRDPKFVEEICVLAPPNQIAHCIDGLVGFYINNFNSLAKGYALCEQLEISNRPACQTAIKNRAALF